MIETIDSERTSNTTQSSTLLKTLIEKKFNLEEKSIPYFLYNRLQVIAQNNVDDFILTLKKEKFYWLVNKRNDLFLLDSRTFLLWQAQPDLDFNPVVKVANNKLIEANWLGIKNWQLSSLKELKDFVRTPENPLLMGSINQIFFSDNWLTNTKSINISINSMISTSTQGKVLAKNCTYIDHVEKLLIDCIFEEWKLISVRSNNKITFELEDAYHLHSTQPYLEIDFKNLNKLLSEASSEIEKLTSRNFNIKDLLSNLDSETSPLPELTIGQLSDHNKGIWELWGQDQKLVDSFCARARNPVKDIKNWPVSIDFGTSSTVVAYQEEGRKKLIRIGVKDFASTVQQEHFENPTVLELVNLPAALKPWQNTAYRPNLQWGDLRCSHEALASMRDNEGDTSITSSILSKIKHWALRESYDLKLRVSDQVSQTEIELPSLTLRNPTKGQSLQVSNEDPFDPIEVYAYFLGLTINWRQRGIFLKYYMTFPVAYPQQVKDKILASFRRGLQRSLPETLICQPEFDQFSVEERASEPAAFAATALPFFNIQPTPEGEAYAVFDFGGGTTDFDFGLYREPNTEEEELGYEEVLEHFGASGDKFLGGENLLEHLAYETFKANLDLCRNNQIAFTCPLDGQDFPGSELLLDKTRAAFTNTQVLMSRLRNYWEKREQNTQGIEKVKLINSSGEEVINELQIPYEKLEAFLNQRLTQGIQNFFTAMHKAFSEAGLQPKRIHVFLAGNASLSPQVQALFGLSNEANEEYNHFDKKVVIGSSYLGSLPRMVTEGALNPPQDIVNHEANTDQNNEKMNACIIDWQHKLFGEHFPEFKIYAPITENPDNPYQATTKTGVALGLLDLCPGSSVAIINRAAIKSKGEAPFDYYTGSIRRRRFKPTLKRHATYNKWEEVGPIRENTFTLVSTQSPAANTGELLQDDPTLQHFRLNLTHADGQKAFIRALAPNKIELCTSKNLDSLEKGDINNLQEIELR